MWQINNIASVFALVFWNRSILVDVSMTLFPLHIMLIHFRNYYSTVESIRQPSWRFQHKDVLFQINMNVIVKENLRVQSVE